MAFINNTEPADTANAAASGADIEEETPAVDETANIPYLSLAEDYFDNELSEVEVDGKIFIVDLLLY